MQVRCWQQHSAAALETLSDSPLHEVRLMLCKVLDCRSSYLFTYPERVLSSAELSLLNNMLGRRLSGEPLAYIFGSWHFYGLALAVSPCTLIPRSDTEILVEQVLSLPLSSDCAVLDLGTGTGAIALALAANRPEWQITAVDLHNDAVTLAKHNAHQLGLDRVTLLQSSWFSALAGQLFDVIVGNPPYIDPSDPHLDTLTFEPLSALVAPDAGLADLRHIISHAPRYLRANGWLWLEHGYNQADDVSVMLREHGFQCVQSVQDYGQQWRITGGQKQ